MTSAKGYLLKEYRILRMLVYKVRLPAVESTEALPSLIVDEAAENSLEGVL